MWSQYFSLQLFFREENKYLRGKNYYPLWQNNLDTQISDRFSSFYFMSQGIVSVDYGNLKIISVCKHKLTEIILSTQ